MLNKLIDHTLLKAYATEADITKLCEEAKEYSFASVCVNPTHVSLAKSLLKDTDVAVCTVIGFPLGANTLASKEFETLDAIKNGADEIDMVINIGKAKEGNFEYIEKEIATVVKAANGKLVKVIIETCYLDYSEKITACVRARIAGAKFVKTSTGFGTAGADDEDVKLMNICPGVIEVKASGGIKTLTELILMVNAGATRIGTSSGVDIMKEARSKRYVYTPHRSK